MVNQSDCTKEGMKETHTEPAVIWAVKNPEY